MDVSPNFDSTESEHSENFDTSSEIEDTLDDSDVVSNPEQDAIYTECTTHAKFPPNSHHLEILKSRFNLDEFKDSQWKVISALLDCFNNKETSDIIDQCIIAASGFGKSLCYQFVPVYTKTLALVISPLISLMQDQVRLMKEIGIPATFLGTGQKDSAHEKIRVFNREMNLLYITPELCFSKGSTFISDLQNTVPICLVAIDEAHCVSSWGHDFRPKYGKLSQIRELMPEVPFIALTATASKIVLYDIVKKLSFKNTLVHTTTLNRPNLYFEFYRKRGGVEGNLKKFLKVNDSLSSNETYSFGCSCIVYCITKKSTERVCQILTKLGVKCSFYHAGMNRVLRKNVHDKFVRNEIECIVATIAFGMGIDKPDVRMILHYGAPKEMESYMQEAGRAGRDKQPSRCIVLSSNSDYNTWRNIISQSTLSNPILKEHRLNQLIKVENFFSSNDCRRKQLLEHFSETYSEDPSIRCCDICTRKLLVSELNLRLLAIRAKLAVEFNVEPIMIFSDGVIMEFAQSQSIGSENIEYEEPILKTFYEKYAPYFSQEIANFMDKNPEIKSKEIKNTPRPLKRSYREYALQDEPQILSQSTFIDSFEMVLSDKSELFPEEDEPKIVDPTHDEDYLTNPVKRTKISSNWKRSV